MSILGEDQIYARHERRRGAILIVGVGGVGSLIADELAHLGYSPLLLIDKDILEAPNLSRHSLGAPFLDESKAKSLAAKIRADLPTCDAHGGFGDFTKLSVAHQDQCVALADLVVDATGELDCQLAVNRACLRNEKPAVYLGVWPDGNVGAAEVGEIQWVLPGNATPCFECATIWRSQREPSRARGQVGAWQGTRASLQVIANATVEIAGTLLNPSVSPGLLDPERTLILTRGIRPPSDAARLLFRERGVTTAEVLLPTTPCPACHAIRRRLTTGMPPSAGSSLTTHPVGDIRESTDFIPSRGVRHFHNLLVLGVIFMMIIVSIIWAVQHNRAVAFADDQQVATETAALLSAAQMAPVDCFVALSDGNDPESAVKHFPCNGVPLARSNYSDFYWVVISLQGVPAQKALSYNVSLVCADGPNDLDRRGGSYDDQTWTGDLKASIGENAVSSYNLTDGVVPGGNHLATNQCELRHRDSVVRSFTVDTTLDPHHQFSVN